MLTADDYRSAQIYAFGHIYDGLSPGDILSRLKAKSPVFKSTTEFSYMAYLSMMLSLPEPIEHESLEDYGVRVFPALMDQGVVEFVYNGKH